MAYFIAAKPTIVLVPGIWHPTTVYTPLTTLLQEHGYTVIPITLPSSTPTTPNPFQADIEAIREVVKAEVDGKRDVVVFCHSYGSVPAGEAVRGLDILTKRRERMEGLEWSRTGGGGGVIGMVHCSGFVCPTGTSPMDILGNSPPPWFDITPDQTTVSPKDAASHLYPDIPEPLRSTTASSLHPHAYQVLSSGKTTWEPWRVVPSTYVYCTRDRMLPHVYQKMMIQRAGGYWREETVEGGGHAAFLSEVGVGVVGRIVRRAGGEKGVVVHEVPT